MPSQIEQRPDYWEQRRRAAVPTDRQLTGPTIEWMRALPSAHSPQNLANRFPRVANALAEAWPERMRAVVMIEQLMLDDRGGERRGFPAAVQGELAQLLALRQSVP